MKQDLAEVVETAKRTRNSVMNHEVGVKEADAVARQNMTIVQAHAIDLRERMFLFSRGDGKAECRTTDGTPKAPDNTDDAIPRVL